MPVPDADLADGIHAHLSVGAPWWSWSWFGLVYPPLKGKVTTTRKERREVRKWYCVWLCTVTQTVDDIRTYRVHGLFVAHLVRP